MASECHHSFKILSYSQNCKLCAADCEYQCSQTKHQQPHEYLKLDIVMQQASLFSKSNDYNFEEHINQIQGVVQKQIKEWKDLKEIYLNKIKEEFQKCENQKLPFKKLKDKMANNRLELITCKQLYSFKIFAETDRQGLIKSSLSGIVQQLKERVAQKKKQRENVKVPKKHQKSLKCQLIEANQKLGNQVKNYKAENQDLREKLQSYKKFQKQREIDMSQNDRLKKQIGTLKNQLKKNFEKHKTCKERLAYAEKQLQVLKVTNQQWSKMGQVYKNMEIEKEKQLSMYKKQNVCMKDQLQMYKKQNVCMKDQLQMYKKQNVCMKQQIQNCQQIKNRAEDCVNELKRQVKSLKQSQLKLQKLSSFYKDQLNNHQQNQLFKQRKLFIRDASLITLSPIRPKKNQRVLRQQEYSPDFESETSN